MTTNDSTGLDSSLLGRDRASQLRGRIKEATALIAAMEEDLINPSDLPPDEFEKKWAYCVTIIDKRQDLIIQLEQLKNEH